MLNTNRHEADDTLLDERVVSLLSAAAAPSEPGPLPGEGAALAAFRSAQVPTRRSSMLSSLIAAKAGVAAAIGAGVLLTGGVAAAATGTLPGAAQDTARDVLSNFGVTVPGAADASAGHADTRGESADAGADRSDETADAETGADAATDASTDTDRPDAAEHGETVSGTATTTDATGEDKGTEISELASEGKAKAGDEHDEHGEQEGTTSGKSVDEQVESEGDETEKVEIEPADDAEHAEHESGDADDTDADEKSVDDHETSGTERHP
ncbi:MAG TPA: hypothetical protein VFY11_09895 [Nocardioidaceae bacterium]|nr:hypothetical protein [Nocardioidaceae bacterium]